VWRRQCVDDDVDDDHGDVDLGDDVSAIKQSNMPVDDVVSLEAYVAAAMVSMPCCRRSRRVMVHTGLRVVDVASRRCTRR
jgi:hypothetical protein